MKLILLLLLLVSQSWAHSPTGDNCYYYKEVEREFKCGKDGYPLQFGFRMCERYLKAEPQLSYRVQKWFPKVRLCLQDYIADNRSSFLDCQDLEKRAIDSHLDCYKKTGYCSLSFLDELIILKLTSGTILQRDVLGLIFRIKGQCLR